MRSRFTAGWLRTLIACSQDTGTLGCDCRGACEPRVLWLPVLLLTNPVHMAGLPVIASGLGARHEPMSGLSIICTGDEVSLQYSLRLRLSGTGRIETHRNCGPWTPRPYTLPSILPHPYNPVHGFEQKGASGPGIPRLCKDSSEQLGGPQGGQQPLQHGIEFHLTCSLPGTAAPCHYAAL